MVVETIIVFIRPVILPRLLATTPASIIVKNTSETAEKSPDGTQWYYWSVETYTEPTNLIDKIKQLTYYLHPTFAKSKFEMVHPPFILRSKGWGEFIIKVDIVFDTGKKVRLWHHLLLGQKENITRKILY